MKKGFFVNSGILVLLLLTFFQFEKTELLLFFSLRNFPTTDWVIWNQETCQAEDVLPPATSNPLTKNYYIEIGDKLEKINFEKVRICAQTKHIFYNFPPLEVVAYHLKTKEQQEKKLFIFLAPAPMLLFQSSTVTFKVSLWLFPFFILLLLVALTLIYPFLNTEEYSFKVLFYSGIPMILFFFVQELRLILFLLDYEIKLLPYHLGLYYSALLLILWLNLYFFFSFLRKPPVGTFFLTFFLSLPVIFLLKTKFENYYYLIFFERLMFLIWWVQIVSFILFFRLKKIVLFLPLLTLSLFFYFLFFLKPSYDAYLVLFYFSFTFPLLGNLSTLLKFGKVYLVLSRSLAFLISAMLLGTVFLAIDQMLGQFTMDTPLRSLIEVILLISITGLAYYIYYKYSDKLKSIIRIGELTVYNDLLKWSEDLLKYRSPEELLSDLEKLLRETLHPESLFLLTESYDSASDEIQYILRRLSKGNENWWTKSGLNDVIMPTFVREFLEEKGTELLYVFPIEEKKYFLVGLGKKARGVYNYSDIELLNTLFRRVALALKVLYLMEREKFLEKQKLEAELSALRSQINPHFLFNTLNTISALIHDSPDLAETAVEELATLFRFTLQHSKEQYIPLKNEMRMIKSYLNIEQIRFGDRLEVNIDIAPETEKLLVPGLVIQTVVENAIKHGIARITGKGKVSIKTYLKDDFLRVEVEDNGPGIDLRKIHRSTGLNNLIKRLSVIFNRSDLVEFQNTGKGTRVIIKFPKLNS